MKLEVGMFVKTKRDGIGRIISLSIGEEDECCFIELSNRRTGIKEHNILKASHNILELIEPMDLMFIDISPDDCGGIVVPRIAETLDELERWKKHISNGYWILKGIVTKEQIESARYEVGE